MKLSRQPLGNLTGSFRNVVYYSRSPLGFLSGCTGRKERVFGMHTSPVVGCVPNKGGVLCLCQRSGVFTLIRANISTSPLEMTVIISTLGI